MKRVTRGREMPESLSPVSRAWTPFLPMQRLQEGIERLFEEPFGGRLIPTPGFFGPWGPPVDVYEDKEKVFVKIELPGMKREEIEVSMREEMLDISGEHKEETEFKGAETYRRERRFGRFHRRIRLPTAVEANKIEAHYKDGILTVTCPKTEEAKRKEIEIKVE